MKRIDKGSFEDNLELLKKYLVEEFGYNEEFEDFKFIKLHSNNTIASVHDDNFASSSTHIYEIELKEKEVKLIAEVW